MKRLRSYIVIICLILSATAFAQRYFTVSTGVGMMFNNSEDLNLFRDTYNYINQNNLSKLLGGFSGMMGLRYDIGYRQIRSFCFAVSIGKQSYGKSEFAQYNNGESRDLTLKMNSTIIELEAGRKIKRFFLAGLMTFYLNRKISMQSTYSGTSSVASKKALTGFFESNPQFSADIGIGAGFYKEPLIFILKISYPVYTGGDEGLLYDYSKDTLNLRSNVFPRDYYDYYYGGTIRGIRSNSIDGFKIGFSVAYAIPI